MASIKVEVPKSRIYETLINGIETTYWARITSGSWEEAWRAAEKPGVRSAFGLIQIEDNYEIEEGVPDPHRPVALNDTQIEAGAKIMAEKYPKHMADILSENDDAITGDVLLQCIFFGGVVYG